VLISEIYFLLLKLGDINTSLILYNYFLSIKITYFGGRSNH